MRTIGKGRISVARALTSTIGATGSVKLVADADAGVGPGVGVGVGVGDGVGVGVGVGVGPGGAAATTTAVVTDGWLIVSSLCLSVIRTPSRKPRSAVVTPYFAAVASAIWSQEPPWAGQRRHWYLTVGAGLPVHVAAAVSVAPTTASPSTVGGEVNAGGASAPSASAGHISSAAVNETRNAGHVWRPMAKLCKTSPLRLSARTVLRPLRRASPGTGLSSGPRALNAPSVCRPARVHGRRARGEQLDGRLPVPRGRSGW